LKRRYSKTGWQVASELLRRGKSSGNRHEGCGGIPYFSLYHKYSAGCMVLGDNVKVASVSVLVEEVNILITSALSSLHILDKASVILHARRLENRTPLRYNDTQRSLKFSAVWRCGSLRRYA